MPYRCVACVGKNCCFQSQVGKSIIIVSIDLECGQCCVSFSAVYSLGVHFLEHRASANSWWSPRKGIESDWFSLFSCATVRANYLQVQVYSATRQENQGKTTNPCGKMLITMKIFLISTFVGGGFVICKCEICVILPEERMSRPTGPGPELIELWWQHQHRSTAREHQFHQQSHQNGSTQTNCHQPRDSITYTTTQLSFPFPLTFHPPPPLLFLNLSFSTRWRCSAHPDYELSFHFSKPTNFTQNARSRSLFLSLFSLSTFFSLSLSFHLSLFLAQTNPSIRDVIPTHTYTLVCCCFSFTNHKIIL